MTLPDRSNRASGVIGVGVGDGIEVGTGEAATAGAFDGAEESLQANAPTTTNITRIERRNLDVMDIYYYMPRAWNTSMNWPTLPGWYHGIR